MMLFPLFSVVLTLSLAVSAQFVSPPTNLRNKTGYAGIQIRYKNVPKGICELDPNVRSIAGKYVDRDVCGYHVLTRYCRLCRCWGQ